MMELGLVDGFRRELVGSGTTSARSPESVEKTLGTRVRMIQDDMACMVPLVSDTREGTGQELRL